LDYIYGENKVVVGLESIISKLVKESKLQIPGYFVTTSLIKVNNSYFLTTSVAFNTNEFYNLSLIIPEDKELSKKLNKDEKFKLIKFTSYLSDLKKFNENFVFPLIKKSFNDLYFQISNRLKNNSTYSLTFQKEESLDLENTKVDFLFTYLILNNYK